MTPSDIPLPAVHITARRLHQRVGSEAIIIPLHFPEPLAGRQPAPIAYHVTAQGGPYLMTAHQAELYRERHHMTRHLY